MAQNSRAMTHGNNERKIGANQKAAVLTIDLSGQAASGGLISGH